MMLSNDSRVGSNPTNSSRLLSKHEKTKRVPFITPGKRDVVGSNPTRFHKETCSSTVERL